MKKLLAILLLLPALLVVSAHADPVLDNDKVDMQALESMSKQLKRVHKKLDRGQFEEGDLSDWTKLNIKMNGAAGLCVSESQKALDEAKEILEGLGDKTRGEDAEVTRKRSTYQKLVHALDKQLAKCNVYVLSSKEVGDKISKAEADYFKLKYLVKSPGVIELLREYLKNPTGILRESGAFIFERSGLGEIDSVSMAVSTLLTVIAILLAVWLRKKLMEIGFRRQFPDDFSGRLIHGFITTFASSLPYITGAGVASLAVVVITAGVEDTLFVSQFFVALLVYFLLIFAVRLLLAPVPPAQKLIGFTPHIAESLCRRFRVLAVLGFLGYLAFYTIFAESIVESNLLLMRAVFSLLFVINLIWMLQVIIRSPKLPRLRYVAMLVIVALVASLIAEWIGYRNLAYASRRGIMGMFLVFVLFVGISKLLRDFFDGVDAGSYAWSRRLHKTLGIEDKDRVPGLIWLRFFSSLVIWGGFAVMLINAVDYSGGTITQLESYIVNGFSIGNFHINPGSILMALLVFGLVIILSSWIRSQLENNWLKMTGMAAGARDAVVTITGYVMFVVALVAGLSVAGFDFGNIALVAGALSVGIGFGLQNIVNNFVSGLILLFERPIRKGDWIMVGNTEGVVKDIQIRSTRIQTFDRSDVIVPNSELISNQVTNWVLSSASGRAIVPVGVAYGTDTALVRDILLKIAEENPNVVKSGNMPEPRVLFREFGDSSLNFELRVFLYNIDKRLSVVSELNFAIDKAFREAGIEIPFPQRDLHIKSMPSTLSPNTGSNTGPNDERKAGPEKQE